MCGSTSATRATDTTDNSSKSSSKVRCRICNSVFSNRRQLIHHRLRTHLIGKGDENAPWVNETGEINVKLKESYELNFPLIAEQTESKSLYAFYNFPITNSFTIDDIMMFVNKIYEAQNRVFRLNLVFGFILFNQEDNEYRYFKPYQNSEVFDFPFYISSRKDLTTFENKLQEIDICTFIVRNRPNTKWKIALVTNVTFHLYFLNHLLGSPISLPDFITKKKNYIISFEKDPKHSKVYNDNLCLFRCLTYHETKSYGLAFEERVKKNFNIWCQFLYENEMCDIRNDGIKKFQGVNIENIHDVEKCFQGNIDVFEIDACENTSIVYKSPCFYDNQMFLNLFGNHVSYITNINRYAKKYVCSICKKHFSTG